MVPWDACGQLRRPVPTGAVVEVVVVIGLCFVLRETMWPAASPTPMSRLTTSAMESTAKAQEFFPPTSKMRRPE